jgi:hypothetical protein
LVAINISYVLEAAVDLCRTEPKQRFVAQETGMAMSLMPIFKEEEGVPENWKRMAIFF